MHKLQLQCCIECHIVTGKKQKQKETKKSEKGSKINVQRTRRETRVMRKGGASRKRKRTFEREREKEKGEEKRGEQWRKMECFEI